MASVNGTSSSTSMLESLCIDNIEDDSLDLILEDEDDSLDICLLDDDVEDYEDDYNDYGSGYEWTDEDAWDAMTDGQYGDYPGSGWDPEMFGY